MITLYDKDNKPVEVPEHEAPQRIADGYGYTADTVIPVRFGDQSGTVPASHIQQALKDGATIATPEVKTPVTAQGVARGIAGATLGAARGFTGGGSDKDVINAAGAVGGQPMAEEYRAKLNTLREEDPTGKVSEFVGSLAPAFMTGGGSVAAKALTGGAEKVAATGLESAAKTGLEEGIANAPRALATAPTSGAEKGALERLIAEGRSGAPSLAEQFPGHVAEEAKATGISFAERNPRLVAESPIAQFPGYTASVTADGAPIAKGLGPVLFAPGAVANDLGHITEAAANDAIETAGKEALGASGVGRVAGVAPAAAVDAVTQEAAPIVEQGVTKALGTEGRSLLSKVLKDGAKGALQGAGEGAYYGANDELTEQRLGGGPVNGEKVLAAAGYGALFGGAAGGALGAGSPLMRHLGGSLAGKVEEAAEHQVIKMLDVKGGSLSAKGSNLTRMEALKGGANGVGRRLLNDGVIVGGQTVKDAAPAIAEKFEQAGQKLGATRLAADTMGIQGPRVDTMLKAIDVEIKDLTKFEHLNQPALREMGALREQVMATANGGDHMTFQTAAELRQKIDSLAKWQINKPATGAEDALRRVRGVIEGETESAFEKSGKKLGKDTLAEYKADKLAFQQYKLANEAAEKAVERLTKNRNVSLTDYLIGGAEIAAGHPLKALALTVGHHVLRERGNSTAAVILDKLSTLRVIQRARDKVDRNIARGVGSIFGDNVAPMAMHDKINAGSAAHQDRINAVIGTLTADHANGVQKAAQAIQDHAPETAVSFQQAAIRASTYLRSLLPVESQDATIQPHLRNVADDMNSAQRASFERSYHVCNDPNVALARVKDGTICPDEVAACKNVYPAYYQQCVDEITSKLAETEKPLPGPTRFAISLFVGDPSLAGPNYTPQYLATMQQQYQTPAAPNGPPKGKTREKAPKLGDLSGITQREQLGGATAKDFKL